MKKIKQFIESEKGKDIMIVIIVILVGLGSFELGRLSKSNDSAGIKIQYPKGDLSQGEDLNTNAIYSQNLSSADTNTPKIILNSNSKTFFASNRGTKYYSISCSAGKTIKQENRIYFTTKEEAEQAGCGLSSSCK
ncbi:MAG: hypothetical protein WCG28_02090 [bacterium]